MRPLPIPCPPRPHRRAALVAMLAAAALGAQAVWAASSAADLASRSNEALQRLTAKVPAAKALAKDAKAVLVFPKVTKAGLGIGGQYGEGALIQGGKAVAFYSTAGASYGLQAGAQTFGYAMFFMNDGALAQLGKNEGFEVGVGPSVVVLDEGKAKTATTTTMKNDIYAFVFGQKGLMAGVGVQGNKITKIDPK
ncbi:MAG TPA: lipid-binding SYLF domain-containing protein [Rubrivivax sp.]|nr:lipid-binding SYLF domain-containing protein [Rubrivivax sp.]